MICKCGHEKSEHYRYINNGQDQGRCRLCDPFYRSRELCVTIISGSKVDQMNKAADHDFVESVARAN